MIPSSILTFENLRGINTKKSKTQRGENEADAAMNGFFDTTGAFIKRRGFRRVNTTEIGSGIDINSIYQFDEEMIVSGGSDLISYDLNSTSETVLSSTLTGNFFDFEEFIPYSQNYLFLTNGQDAPMKYNGTTLSNLSIVRPSTQPTATPTAGGSLTTNSSYQIAVTFVRNNGSGEVQESNPSNTVTVSAVSMGINTRIALTNVPVSTDSQVNERRIYLSRPNGAILYLQGTIANNVATTYNIDTNVDVLEDPELEYDHDSAPNAYIIEKYKNRLVLSGDEDFPDRVYVSKANAVWYFPQGQLDEGSILYFSIGEKVTSIKSYYDLVFIFGENGHIFILQGDDESNFVLSSVINDDNVTCVSDRSVVVQENWCYFLHTDGYYRTNGQVIQKMSEPISAYFDPENQQDNQFNVSGFSYGFNQIVPVAIYYKPLNQILLWITQSGQLDYVNNICFALHTSNIVLEGDTITPNYSIYTGVATRCTAPYQTTNNTKYFLVAQSNGFVFEAEKGRYDGAAVNSTATSSTNLSLTDSIQAWTVNAFAELWLYIRVGTGAGQMRRIVSNTSNTLTISAAWNENPDSSSEYSIGGISYIYTHSYNAYGNKSLSKRLIYVRPRLISEGDAIITLSFGYDFIDMRDNDVDPVEISVSGASLWDVALWDVGIWDGPTVFDNKVSAAASRIHRWSTIKITNLLADQSIEYDGCDKIFEMKGVQ